MDKNRVIEEYTRKAEDLKHAAQRAKETAHVWGNRARDRARDAGAAADLYVHEYAWTTLICAITAAAVLGFLLGRKR